MCSCGLDRTDSSGDRASLHQMVVVAVTPPCPVSGISVDLCASLSSLGSACYLEASAALALLDLLSKPPWDLLEAVGLLQATPRLDLPNCAADRLVVRPSIALVVADCYVVVVPLSAGADVMRAVTVGSNAVAGLHRPLCVDEGPCSWQTCTAKAQ